MQATTGCRCQGWWQERAPMHTARCATHLRCTGNASERRSTAHCGHTWATEASQGTTKAKDLGKEGREHGILRVVYRFAYRKTCNSCNSCKPKRYTSGGIPFSWLSQAPLAPTWPSETPIWLQLPVRSPRESKYNIFLSHLTNVDTQTTAQAVTGGPSEAAQCALITIRMSPSVH